MSLPAILQQLGMRAMQQNPNLARIKELMNTVKTAQNPQTALQALINNNPQLKQAMDLVQQNGGDPEKAFYKLAEEKGVNPDDILNMLK